MTKDRRLGRGLAALLGTPGDDTNHGESHPPAETLASQAFAPRLHRPSVEQDDPADDGAERSERPETADSVEHDAGRFDATADGPAIGGIVYVDIESIEPNPFQPRREFTESEIASLSESLKSHEMLQPILLRKVEGRYQLISGERRWRAAAAAGWRTIPARVREADDRLVAELAIVENLQRKDLNPIEKAMSFQRYLTEHQCSQDDLAARLKIDRSTIANLIRILELPDQVRAAVASNTITAGHARALLPLGDEPLQIEFASLARDEGWSVRDTEQRVREKVQQLDGNPLAKLSGGKPRTRDDHLASLSLELKRSLGTKVDIKQTARGRGKIVIQFTSHEEFERLFDLLTDNGSSTTRAAG